MIDVDNIKTDELTEFKSKRKNKEESSSKTDEKSSKIKPKKNLKPILQKLSERKPMPLDYIGTSFGVTKELFTFWKKNEFVPIYLR